MDSPFWLFSRRGAEPSEAHVADQTLGEKTGAESEQPRVSKLGLQVSKLSGTGLKCIILTSSNFCLIAGFIFHRIIV